MTIKECEFDPDHLYHDHHELDALRTENEQLRQQLESRVTIAEEIERRREAVSRLSAENERLRAALTAGVATHGEMCGQRLQGKDCQFMRDAREALARDKARKSDQT